MAKKVKQSENIRYAVNKKHQKLARERAAQEQAKQEKRAETNRKNRQAGQLFLWSVLSLVGAFCLYTLIRGLFFQAASVSELRSNLLFVSVVAIPYLLAAAAVILRALTKKKREAVGSQVRRTHNLIFLAALLAAFLLFGGQFLRGKRDASNLAAYSRTAAALEQSGLSFSRPEQPEAFRSLLELDLETDLLCGKTVVRLNSHAGSTGWTAQRFLGQVALDYADYPSESAGEDPAVTVWGPVEQNGSARAALAARIGNEVRILELFGPPEEVETLVPLLTASLNQP